MKHKARMWRIVGGGALILLLVTIGTAAYARQEPPWNPAYFTPDVRQRYTTPQDCFVQYVKALQSEDAAHYNEVLGYDGAQDADFPLFRGEPPEIAELTVEGNRAFIFTTNPSWEVHLHYVNRRWVFEPESFRLLVREALGL